MRTEELIADLSAGLRPVRRLPAPGWQAAAWLALAVGAIGLCVAVQGLRHDIAARLHLMPEVAQWLASVATGATAALAAAMLARPDRSRGWALLPVLPLAAWVGTLGWGCMADMDRMGPAAMELGTSWGCLRFILLLGLPLTAALLLLLRHAGPVRPLPVLLLGGLASAALCSAGLSLFHHLDAALMVLLWHGGAVALVALLGWAVGRPLLLRPVTSRNGPASRIP